MGLMNYSYQDVVARLQVLGYLKKREAKGSHELWMSPNTGVVITINFHAGKNLSKGVIKNIVKSTGLTNKEFHDLD